MAYFERASSSKIFFEQYRVRAFFEQDFFEQFRVRVLWSGLIFERAEQNFEQTAAQSQHYQHVSTSKELTAILLLRNF